MRGFSKLLPALTGLMTVCASSALALNHHGNTPPPPNPHPASTLTPKLCNVAGLVGDASAVFVNTSPRTEALELNTSANGADIAYGDLRNPVNPQFLSLQFDAAGLDPASIQFVDLFGSDPITGLNDQATFLLAQGFGFLSVPLAPTQPGHGFTRFLITAATASANGTGAPPSFIIGTAFRRCSLIQLPSSTTSESLLFQNVVLNANLPAQAVLVTAINDCQDL